MADARSMLRAARVERRIQHPNAQYSASAKLLCSLCEMVIKDDKKAWGNHLRSTQHTQRADQAQNAAKTIKKRKVEDVEDAEEDQGTEEDRKRVKAGLQVDEDATESAGPDDQARTDAEQDQTRSTAVATQPNVAQDDAVDEAEFAAFLGDLEASEQEEQRPPDTVLTSAATIFAAPMTAEQLAAQAREEQSSQRVRRDVEIAAEREDAAERLEQEFEEMEEFEDRVKKLKAKREALRRSSAAMTDDAAAVKDLAANHQAVVEAIAEESEDDDDDGDEDEFNVWGFGST